MHETFKTTFIIFIGFLSLEFGGSLESLSTFKRATLSADSRSRVLS